MTEETSHSMRHLPLNSVQNMRDLGGYRTHDKNKTQWRRFLRSASMHELTDADQNKLIDFGVASIVDLRSEQNIEDEPNVFANSEKVTYHHHDLWGDRLENFQSAETSINQAEKLADLYRTGLFNCIETIGEIMIVLAGSGDCVSVFHCVAGKDRTGLISALLLGIAGVPEETIAKDFALTEHYLDSPGRDHTETDPLAIPPTTVIDPNSDVLPLPVYIHSCLPETMMLTLTYLNDEYGGVEDYVRASGLTDTHIRKLRSKLLD